MKLVVAEKPSVAKSIAEVIGANARQDGYLEGNGYCVTWCYGHLIELYNADEYDPELKKWEIKDLPIIPEPFKTKPQDSTKAQYEKIKSLMKEADEIICATDAGREGELIFRLVYEQAGCRKPVKRLWISSLENSAIRNGFNNLKPESEYDNLYMAAKARQEADWLLGINLTRLYTCQYRVLLACGRVQTPVVNLIVERENEIKNFKSVPYWVISAELENFTVTRKENTKEDLEKCLTDCEGKPCKIRDVQKKKVNENPKPLYDLTSLQQDANRLFGLSAQETLDILQGLYEKKLTTYPRTDSRYITGDQKKSVTELIETLRSRGFYKGVSDFGGLSIDRVINDRKVTDHHAILPTVEVTEDKYNTLTDNEKHILSLVIWKLLLAVGPTYVYEATKVIGDIDKYEFTCDGRKDIIAGFKEFERAFKAFLGISGKTEEVLPEVKAGEEYPVKALTSEEKETLPPKRYTEATLLSAMETCGKKMDDLELKEAMKDKGLGTPATRAGIIESVIKSKYIERQKKNLVPTEKAFKFISICTDVIKKPELTGKWEYQLALIQKGELNKDTFLNEIKVFLESFIKTSEIKSGVTFEGAGGAGLKVLGKCPKCGADIVSGKYGAYCKNKCGMYLGRVMGQTLTDSQISKLLDGKKVLMKGLVSKKSGKTYDAYFVPAGIEAFSYTNKEGKTVSGYQFKIEYEFPKNTKKT